MSQEAERFIIDRYQSNPMSKEEIDDYEKKGWELMLGDQQFYPSEPSDVPIARYIFRKKV